MNIIEPNDKKPLQLKIGDVLVSGEESYVLIKNHNDKYSFASITGEYISFNGEHSTIEKLLEDLNVDISNANSFTIYSSDNYSLQLVPKK